MRGWTMHDMTRLKNKIAVIGVGNTRYGNFPEADEYGLAAQAFRNAVRTVASARTRSTACCVCRIPYYARMGEVLGLNPRWTLTMLAHGRMSGMGIIEAAIAIAAGHCDYVALMYANISHSRRVNYGGDENPRDLGPVGHRPHRVRHTR